MFLFLVIHNVKFYSIKVKQSHHNRDYRCVSTHLKTPYNTIPSFLNCGKILECDTVSGRMYEPMGQMVLP